MRSTVYTLYNTDLIVSTDEYDCLRITNKDIVATANLDYCQRRLESITYRKHNSCLSDAPVYFRDLKEENMTSKMLLEIGIPIDVIDSYMLYLETGNGKNNYICHCTWHDKQWFGAQCQYVFAFTALVDTARNYQNLFGYLLNALDTNLYESTSASFTITNGTCYIDASGCITEAGNCLHWNQICDGQIDCNDGSDEVDCLTLELNECNDKTEYRCRQGTCIPLQAAFDKILDCLDASDEYRYVEDRYQLSSDFFVCDQHELTFCHEHFCGNNAFACGDGTCSHRLWTKPKCSTQRDLRYVQNILSTSLTDSDSCWTFTICQLGFQIFFRNLTSSICSNSTCKKNLFFFPAEHYIAHPSVQFIYKTKRNYASGLIDPDYVCFDDIRCKNHNWSILIISNKTCVPWNKFIDISYLKYDWDTLILIVRQMFASCFSHGKKLVQNNFVFNCDQSFYISRHRLKDGYSDCPFSDDETEVANTCVLNLANRFQCKTNKNECIPRLYLSDGIKDCTDGSDEKIHYDCASDAFEAGCKWKRGSLEATTIFNFHKLCDGFVDFSENNITDEDNCPSLWLVQCYSSLTRCDNHWHCRNGFDELNCAINQFDPCIKNQEFYCINKTDSQSICYSSELSGDGHEDCVGAIDERVGGFCQMNYPTDKEKRFRCRNSNICIDETQLCNGIKDCPPGNDDDESILCPWLSKVTGEKKKGLFICQNGDILSRSDRCNGNEECTNGEDELFCHLSDPIWDPNNMNVVLFDMNVYPRSIISSFSVVEQKKIDESHKSELISKSKRFVNLNENDLYNTWYCNRGLLAYDRMNKKNMCFCPFYLYGERCEYQRRRVTMITQLDASDLYSNNFIPLKFVFYLINQENNHIIAYHERIIIPYLLRTITIKLASGRFFIPLLFPIRQNQTSQHVKHFVKIDAFIISNESLDLQASWYFDLPFPYLPVQRLVPHLILLKKVNIIVGVCTHGKRISYFNNNTSWCYCESGWTGSECDRLDSVCHPNPCFQGSICISVRKKPVCLCTENRFGPTCRIPMSFICHYNPCKNNGTCYSIDSEGQLALDTFHCLCVLGFTGINCEKEAARLNIAFDPEIVQRYPSISAMAVRLSLISDTRQYDTFRYLFKHIQLEQTLPTIYRNRKDHRFDFAFIQIFTKGDNIFGEYYLIARNNTLSSGKIESHLIMHLNTTVVPRNHCPYIDKLFNKTILKLLELQRAKYYQEPCNKNGELVCFHDENLMCSCNRFRMTQCFTFVHQDMNCSISHSCLNEGLCLQEDEIRNPLDYICICKECFFGDLCQFTTSQFSISVDALIGSMIIIDKSIQHQSFIIQFCFVIILLLFFLAFFFNTLTLIVFLVQKKCRLSGCGLYIIVSSTLSTVCLITLMIKFITLVIVPHLSNKISCILIEYFLKCFPTMVEWINACIVLERVWTVRMGIKFNRNKSKKIAKMIIPMMIILTGLSLIHDPLHRQSVIDPRLDITRRPWCVVKFDKKKVQIYNMVINLFHYLIPFIISVISTIFIFLNLAKTKSKAKHHGFTMALKEQLSALKNLIISPVVLVILAMPRIVFALVFSCISSSTSWQTYLLLISYFISFLPQTGTFFIFVLTSNTYKTELSIFVKNIRRH